MRFEVRDSLFLFLINMKALREAVEPYNIYTVLYTPLKCKNLGQKQNTGTQNDQLGHTFTHTINY